MNSKPTLSIAIATYNEELNIKPCLDTVNLWADEIILVDGHSSDNTVKIAKIFTKVRIINVDNQPNFHLNKQTAISACKCDWILQLDADERVSPDLKDEIIKVISSSPTQNGFWIKRKNFFLGKFLTKGGAYPDPTIRLYRNGKAALPCLSVHEQVKVDGSVGWLNSDLLHLADPTFSRYLLRNNRYTTLKAQELRNQKVSLSLLSFFNFYFFKPIFRFLQIYLRHKGFLDGFPGFIFAFYSSLVYPIAYTKYYELKKTNREINQNDWDN